MLRRLHDDVGPETLCTATASTPALYRLLTGGCGGSVSSAAVQSAADLAADLARKVPTKIDIGPVYTHDPRQRAKYAKGERNLSSKGHAASMFL